MKIWFWIKSHIWRTLMIVIPVYAGLSYLGAHQSYILAILNGFGVYGVMFIGQLAYAEEIKEQHEKEVKRTHEKFTFNNVFENKESK